MRALAVLILLAVAPFAVAAQPLGVLHIKVGLPDAGGSLIPIPRVVLLVSDNPPSGEPRRIVTTAEGTVDVRLRPGNYTVESDQAIAFEGKAYTWTQNVDVTIGRDASLELNAGNAEAGEITTATKTVETGSLVLFRKVQDSVIELWSPSAHASGFLVDSKGLIVTNQRSLGNAESIEVQIAPALKVAGRVLSADRLRDVAIVWINPQVAASITPLTVTCAPAAPRSVDDDLFTIVTPLLGRKDMTWGKESELRIGAGSSGGPVFSREGNLVGFTTDGESDRGARAAARLIPIHHSCDVIAAAEKKMIGLTPPAATKLPVEPSAPPAGTAAAGAPRKPTDVGGLKISSDDYELAFLPPMRAAERRGLKGALLDFGNWTDYVLAAPPLLFVRAMPKLEESLLMTVARGAAATQGMAIPPIKRYKSSFLRMLAYCGDEEVSPIHPFVIEHPINEKDTVKEGLYVFDPDALGPHCKSVKFMMYSEKAPDRADTRSIDPALLK
jgi:hypothetical protein